MHTISLTPSSLRDKTKPPKEFWETGNETLFRLTYGEQK